MSGFTRLRPRRWRPENIQIERSFQAKSPRGLLRSSAGVAIWIYAIVFKDGDSVAQGGPACDHGRISEALEVGRATVERVRKEFDAS
jgi:hypothetical protein